MRPVKKDLAPVVKSILSDVQCTAMGGIRIPKDKFMMWISILRKQHKGNESIFLQLAVLGVEFVRQKVSFVSDQFFILAAVGLDAARVGAMIAPEDVETKVASMFVQKFQAKPTNFGAGAALAPIPRPTTRRPTVNRTNTTQMVDISAHSEYYKPTSITEPNTIPGSRPAPATQNNVNQERTRVETVPGSSATNSRPRPLPNEPSRKQ